MSTNDKPYAEACDQNGPPILEVLKRMLPAEGELLEIGSGTGQHAVMFARQFPDIIWQTSDRQDKHQGMQLWIEEAGLPNLRSPIALDVLHDTWPDRQFDSVFSANTAHIMPVEGVVAMFRGVAQVLRMDAPFLLYGPFMYDGRYTSESNREFDRWLGSREAHQGIRDVAWLKEVAGMWGLELDQDIEMPVNNRTLVWTRIN